MTTLDSHSRALADFWKGEILWDKPMSRYSTLKVGGPAEAIIPVKSIRDLQRLMQWLQEKDIQWRVIGKGSNILVPDQGLAGITIMLEGEFNAIEEINPSGKIIGETALIQAGGGCLLSGLLNYCIENSLSGLEFTVGIPGSIGGAVVMNAGAWGHEIGDFLVSAALMDSSGNIITEPRENLGFTYRGWSVKPHTLLLYATLALKTGRTDEIKGACRRYHELRKTTQPLSEPSAGSFFKNPPDHSAGRLIDQAGLKGHAVGGAKVSEKHANFIVNTGNASAADILHLMRHVQDIVYKQFGVTLEPEIHILDNEGQL